MSADQETPAVPESQSSSAEESGSGAAPAQQSGITLDDSSVIACYANFCRVSSTPEELILDLGLNPEPMRSQGTVRVSERIVMNHFTAKRLLGALSMALQRHEQTFGVLETDIRRRVRQP